MFRFDFFFPVAGTLFLLTMGNKILNCSGQQGLKLALNNRRAPKMEKIIDAFNDAKVANAK